MKEETRILKALANERRLKSLKILFSAGQLPVNEISNRLNLSFKSTSKHLLILERAGFLSRKQIETTVFYSIAKAKPRTFLARILGAIRKQP